MRFAGLICAGLMTGCSSLTPRLPAPDDSGALLLCVQAAESLECVTEKDGRTKHYSVPTVPEDEPAEEPPRRPFGA